MRRKEDQVVAKDAAPNYGSQYPRACLCYDTSAFVHGQLVVESKICLRLANNARSLTDYEVVVKRQPFLLRSISPPSEKRLLLAGPRLSVFFLVSHISEDW